MKLLNTRRHYFFVSLICLVTALSGCNLNNDNVTDERLRNNDSIEFFNRSGWQACAAGTVGGALVGTLACSSKEKKDKYLCIAGSAIAGCGIGIGVNAYLDYQRSKYKTVEERLTASLIDIQRDNAKLEELTKNAKAVIADDRNVLVRMQKDIATNTLDKNNAEKKIAQIDANLDVLNNSVTQIKSREKQWNTVKNNEAKQAKGKGAKKSVAMLDKEINKMRHQVAMLQQEVDGLYSLRSAIKVS